MSALGILLSAIAAPVVGWLLMVAVVAVAYLRRALYFARFGPSAAIPWRTLLRILVVEALNNWRIIGWWVTRRGEDLLEGDGRPVVLVHGLSADGTSMYAMRRALWHLGRRTVSPHLGHIFRPIEQYADRLALELGELGEEMDVVAHSMGGIVLRCALQRHPELCSRVRSVVTVATPHHGTGSARFLPLPEARQLVPNGPWLQQLPALPALVPHARLCTISSDADAVVYPVEHTRMAGATAHELRGLGHSETLLHPTVVDLVVTAVS